MSKNKNIENYNFPKFYTSLHFIFSIIGLYISFNYDFNILSLLSAISIPYIYIVFVFINNPNLIKFF